MNAERRWQAKFVARVLLNGGVGALLMALAGTLCGLITGALIAWVLGSASAAVGIPNPYPTINDFVIPTGFAGLMLGSLLGAIIFSIAAARAQPGRTFEPLRALVGRVALGQIVGTLGFCSLFVAAEWARASLSSQSFFMAASDHVGWLFWGVPILMICGAVAGAFSKRS